MPEPTQLELGDAREHQARIEDHVNTIFAILDEKEISEMEDPTDGE